MKKQKKVIDFQLEERLPTVTEFQQLRASTDWGDLSDDMVETALGNSLFSVCATHENKIIGTGRIIGDGALYYYIQDMMVLVEFRGRGIGQAMLSRLLKLCLTHAEQGAFIALMAAHGAQSLYLRNGFVPRSPEKPGMQLPPEHWDKVLKEITQK